MAGEQSEIMQALLKGNLGEESKQEARNLTCLRLLRRNTESFDKFIAGCLRVYAQLVHDVTNSLREEGHET